MSSAVISTTAAQGRFFVLDAETQADVCTGEASSVGGVCPAGTQRSALSSQPALDRARIIQATINNQQSKILASVAPASRLEVCPAPEMVSSGIAAIDALTGGLPRGCLTEIYGPASSGRTTLLLAALSAATHRGEVCAVVDAGDALDPQSAADAGVDLDRMLWVRCGTINSLRRHRGTEEKNHKNKNALRHPEHSLEQLLRAADLLLESGGFGLIALDLADLLPQIARRIPLTTWFRFRRAVEHTPTVLLAMERQSIAGSCSSLLIKLRVQEIDANQAAKRRQNAAHSLPRACRGGVSRGSTIQNNESAPEGQKKPTHAQLLTEIEITAEVVRSRMKRKPARSAEIIFTSQTAWTG